MDFNLDDVMGFASDPKPKTEFPVKVKNVRTTNNHPEPIVAEPTIELCLCGHPQDAHEDGDGNCEILECDCISWCPPSHTFTATDGEVSEAQFDARIEALAAQPDDTAVAVSITPAPVQVCVCGHTLEEHSKPDSSCAAMEVPEDADGKGKPCACECWRIPALQVEETLPEPNHDEPMPEGYCQHLCENEDCQKWWTHGLKAECQFPDILKQGLCQHCSTNNTTFQMDPSQDFKDGKIVPAAQIKIRNDEQFICKDMSIEQLTNHIFFLHKRIEELRIRSLHARKMRSDLEEEELANIPQHEREEFIQALRRGQKKGEKKPRATKKAKDPSLLTGKAKEAALKKELEAKGKSTEEAKALASIMVKTGKSLEWAEKFLND